MPRDGRPPTCACCWPTTTPLVRSGIRRILEAQPDIEVVAEVADGAAALRAVSAHPEADVLVLDLNDARHGRRRRPARAARRWRPAARDRADHARRARIRRARGRAGADGYLLKDSAVADLVAAIRAVMAGRAYFSPPIQQQLAGLVRPRASPRASRTADRPRARSAGWLARGLSTGDGRELDISVRTVETHRANLMRKLGVKSVAMLIQVAIREGILEQP